MANFQRGVPGEARKQRTLVSRFRANWDSECITCDGAIFEGDDIGYIGKNAEGVSCDDCCSDAENDG